MQNVKEKDSQAADDSALGPGTPAQAESPRGTSPESEGKNKDKNNTYPFGMPSETAAAAAAAAAGITQNPLFQRSRSAMHSQGSQNPLSESTQQMLAEAAWHVQLQKMLADLDTPRQPQQPSTGKVAAKMRGPAQGVKHGNASSSKPATPVQPSAQKTDWVQKLARPDMPGHGLIAASDTTQANSSQPKVQKLPHPDMHGHGLAVGLATPQGNSSQPKLQKLPHPDMHGHGLAVGLATPQGNSSQPKLQKLPHPDMHGHGLAVGLATPQWESSQPKLQKLAHPGMPCNGLNGKQGAPKQASNAQHLNGLQMPSPQSSDNPTQQPQQLPVSEAQLTDTVQLPSPPSDASLPQQPQQLSGSEAQSSNLITDAVPMSCPESVASLQQQPQQLPGSEAQLTDMVQVPSPQSDASLPQQQPGSEAQIRNPIADAVPMPSLQSDASLQQLPQQLPGSEAQLTDMVQMPSPASSASLPQQLGDHNGHAPCSNAEEPVPGDHSKHESGSGPDGQVLCDQAEHALMSGANQQVLGNLSRHEPGSRGEKQMRGHGSKRDAASKAEELVVGDQREHEPASGEEGQVLVDQAKHDSRSSAEGCSPGLVSGGSDEHAAKASAASYEPDAPAKDGPKGSADGLKSATEDDALTPYLQGLVSELRSKQELDKPKAFHSSARQQGANMPWPERLGMFTAFELHAMQMQAAAQFAWGGPARTSKRRDVRSRSARDSNQQQKDSEKPLNGQAETTTCAHTGPEVVQQPHAETTDAQQVVTDACAGPMSQTASMVSEGSAAHATGLAHALAATPDAAGRCSREIDMKAGLGESDGTLSHDLPNQAAATAADAAAAAGALLELRLSLMGEELVQHKNAIQRQDSSLENELLPLLPESSSAEAVLSQLKNYSQQHGFGLHDKLDSTAGMSMSAKTAISHLNLSLEHDLSLHHKLRLAIVNWYSI